MIEPIQIEHSNLTKCWEQQGEESNLAFLYFKCFLDLGPQRSLEESHRVLLKDKQIQRTPHLKTLREYRNAYRWDYRADLFDRWTFAQESRLEAERRREELRIGLEQYRQFQQQLGQKLAGLAELALDRTTTAVREAPPESFDLNTAVRLMSVLNSTAREASTTWSDSLGVEKLTQSLAELEANEAMQAYDFATDPEPDPELEPAQ